MAAVTRSADLPEIPAPQRALIQEFLVIAELQRDELAGAQMWADRAVASIRSCDVAMSHSAALRASARARSAAGDQEGAVADGLAAVVRAALPHLRRRLASFAATAAAAISDPIAAAAGSTGIAAPTDPGAAHSAGRCEACGSSRSRSRSLTAGAMA